MDRTRHQELHWKALTQTSAAGLRRPVQIVKKRSGPLEDTLAEVSGSGPPLSATSSCHSPTATDPSDANTSARAATHRSSLHTSHSPLSSHRKSILKERKEKKRERWLLTRKTWKYMTDAGRKLIPDGAQNRTEDIPKIERHFHQVCSGEPRFILWRRKVSFPGATRNSKRRLKQLLSHTGLKTPQSVEAAEQEEADNADKIIDLLQSVLKLDESRKTTTLLGSKTVRPDQTSSPSAQRPSGFDGGSSYRQTSSLGSARGPGFLPPEPPKGLQALSEIDQLLERLRVLSLGSKIRPATMPFERITPDILEDKALLKQIYNDLKKQQLHRILGRHSQSVQSHLPHSTSLSTLWNFGSSFKQKKNALQQKKSPVPTPEITEATEDANTVAASSTTAPFAENASPAQARTRKPPFTLDLPGVKGSRPLQQLTPEISTKKASARKARNSCGTQTNFIPLQDIKHMAEEYKERKRENALAAPTSSATDDEVDRSGSSAGHHHRRRSSIDNEDVSQSVSDTIKRYLRMARKKSVQGDSANRFKRVNYDQNLRNIRAKGEINPPGIDEDMNKAVQTLDAWPAIMLDFIRGRESSEGLAEAHAEWDRALEERIRKKREYEQKQAEQAAGHAASQKTTSAGTLQGQIHSSSSSAPTSPTTEQHLSTVTQHSGVASGILHSSTQFLSNLLHGASGACSANQAQGIATPTSDVASSSSNNSKDAKVTEPVMQKSKSSSSVGQFVSKKLLRSRSKSQTRSASQLPRWTPADKFTWTSDTGASIELTDVCLLELSEIEAKILQKVALEKINELNIGVPIVLPGESDVKSTTKRRALSKKKAMTTSFFDIGRKEDRNSNISVFGNSLEACIANDRKRLSSSASADRGSRNSIASLFRSSSSKVRSCESLASSNTSPGPQVSDADDGGESAVGKESGVDTSSSKGTCTLPTSRSHSDIRRNSKDCESEELQLNAKPSGEKQVPAFIRVCIKHLEDHGLHLVGLFRVSTSKKRLRQLREEFDRNSSSPPHLEAETCPHDVATLLKEFLRDLPEPLLCRSLYKAFLETQRIRNRRLQLEAISHLVKLLPPAHRDTLFTLLRFLAHVAACSDDVCNSDGSVRLAGNKMDSNNLATVFAPNMLRTSLPGADGQKSAAQLDASSEQESVADAINVIRIMIDHYEELFRVPAELVNVVYTHMFDVYPQQLNSLCDQRHLCRADDVESPTSGGSMTPLTPSPPPSANERSATLALEAAAGGFRAAMSTQPTVPARRTYTRESVMHQNSFSQTGFADINGASSGGGSQSRNSKQRTTSAQRHLFEAPPTQQELRREEQLQPATTSEMRRQSSPYLLSQTGVITASLQIPVQMQPHSDSDPDAPNPAARVVQRSSTKATIDHRAGSLLALDSEKFNEGSSITGSLHFGAVPTSYSRKLAAEARGMTTSQRDLQQQQQQKSARTTLSSKSSVSSFPAAAQGGSVNGSGNRSSAEAATLEPRLPASISSIGGAILRSKTADFERMSTSRGNTGSSGAASASPPQQQQQQHHQQSDRRSTSHTTLYKRQAIISSAKRTTTNKRSADKL